MVLGTTVILATLTGPVISQESAPVEPSEEEQAGRYFKETAPDLFQAWQKGRPAYLRQLRLGRLLRVSCTGVIFQFVAFTECEDSVAPTDYRMDVKKTESMMTPFIGVLIIPIKMRCTVQHSVPAIISAKKLEAQLGACLGQNYEECKAAHMSPMRMEEKQFCGLMGLGKPFSYEGEVRITYGFTDGKWELENQSENPPVRQPSTSAIYTERIRP